MTLSAQECALYAQVVPVFVVAAIAGHAFWARGVAARRFNPMWLFSAAILLGGIASYDALTHASSGATGWTAGRIQVGGWMALMLTTATGAIAPIAEDIVRVGERLENRAAARRARRREAKELRNARRRPTTGDNEGSEDEQADGSGND